MRIKRHAFKLDAQRLPRRQAPCRGHAQPIGLVDKHLCRVGGPVHLTELGIARPHHLDTENSVVSETTKKIILGLAGETPLTVDPDNPALRAAAARSGRSVAELVREAVRKALLIPQGAGPVALWDGEPARGRGGTAEVVELARRRGGRVEIVPVDRPGGPR